MAALESHRRSSPLDVLPREVVNGWGSEDLRAALDCVIPGHAPIAEAEASDPEDTSNPVRLSAGQGSKMSLLVDAGGLSPNTWERIERLSSMWEQAKQGVGSERPRAGEPDFGVVFNPTRRSRTPLTENEVDAIRAAREAGETVTSIARRFEVHRLTVWERTRDLPVSK